MANFENGLPPANTDLTDKKVSDINIITQEYDDSQHAQGIHNVMIQQKEAKALAQANISSILYQARKVDGNNTVLFYL